MSGTGLKYQSMTLNQKESMNAFYEFYESHPMEVWGTSILAMGCVSAYVAKKLTLSIQLMSVITGVLVGNILYMNDVAVPEKISTAFSGLGWLVTIAIGIVAGSKIHLSHLRGKLSGLTIITFAVIYFASVLIFTLAGAGDAAWALAIFPAETGLPFVYLILHSKAEVNSNRGELSLAIAAIKEIPIWTAFAVVSMLQTTGSHEVNGYQIVFNLGMFVVFSVICLGPLRLLLKVTLYQKTMKMYETIMREKTGTRDEKMLKLARESKVVYYVVLTCIAAGAGMVTSYLGVHNFLGYILIGMTLPSDIAKRVERDFTYFLFEYGTIFFSFAGLRVIFTGSDVWPFAITFVLLIIGSILSGWSTTFGLRRYMNIDGKTAGIVGRDMNIKGMMAIIVALLFYTTGILNQSYFNAVMLSALALTLWRGVFTEKTVSTVTSNSEERVMYAE